MGFYGNITNTARTQFQFDKIYPNRYEMEIHKSTDGIYAGRYVLVEYDSEANLDTYLRVQKVGDRFYENPTGEVGDATLLKQSDIGYPSIVYVSDIDPTPAQGLHAKNCTFYICVSELTEGSQQPAIFNKVISGKEGPDYTINYNIDISEYKNGRGYDSTVWQKTYIDGVEKYVMIAELNSVVPTFDVSADAPTQRPLVPHFDIQSTDVYYKLHWQPSWGFRIKQANLNSNVYFKIDLNANTYETNRYYIYDNNTYTLSDGEFDENKIYYDCTTVGSNSSVNNNVYPSDEWASHYTYDFNPGTGTNEQNEPQEYAAAIYYNKDGFKKETRTYYTGNYGDSIIIEPTGQSGNEYNIHDGSSNSEVQPDIQEMRILLPSLGNTISDIWDIVYGYDPDNDNKRFRDIKWKDAVTGTEDEDLGGMTRNLETFAGCINSVHDLMGMITTNKSDSYLSLEPYYREIKLTLANYIPDEYYIKSGDDYVLATGVFSEEQTYFNKITIGQNWYDKNYIYKDGSSYYRIHQYPVYEKVDVNLPNPDNYESDQEYNKAYEQIVSTLTGNHYIANNNNENPIRTVKAFNEKAVIAALKEGKILVKESGVAYEFREIKEFAKNLGTINGCILQMKNLLEAEDFETRDRATVTGAINTLNDIIDVFEDLIPGEFLICDANGRVNSANWTTAQDYTYKNYNVLNPSAATKTFSTKENRWLSLSLDENKKEISLTHKFNPIPDTTTTSDKNVNSGDGINKNPDDFIKLYTPIVDNMGHIVGHNIETITLPYNYKSIKSNELISTDDEDLYTIIIDGDATTDATSSAKIDDNIVQTDASNSKDLMNINTANKWIQTKVTDDTISIAHEIHAIKEVKRDTNLNELKDNKIQNTITVQDTAYDAAGHVIENRKHTYTLPFGYKVIKASNTEDNVVSAPASVINTSNQIADSTQDELTLSASNRWIKIDNNTEDTVKFGHKLSSFAVGTEANTYYGLTQDEPISSLDADNTFEVPCLKFDEAGHILEARTHKVTLPENFTKITVTNSDNTDATKLVGIPGAVEADNLTANLTIAEGNRWINIDADSDNDKITFSHYVDPIESTTNASDLNTVTKKTIPVHELVWDKAGHITSNVTHTYTIPDNFKTVSIQNNGNNLTQTNITALNSNLVAGTMVDTVTFDTGNRWIQFIGDKDTNKVTIYHAKPGTAPAKNTTKTGNEEPAFGATFDIPEVTYDEAGHIYSVDTHTVKIPLPSINENKEATTASVLTGIQLVPTTGVITQTNANVGTLALTGFDTLTTASSMNLSANDKINEAFGKLELRIKTEETNRENAIKGLDVPDSEVEGQYVSAVSETDGKISVSRKTIPTYSLSTGTSNGTVKFNNTDVNVKGLGSAAYTNSNAYATAAQGQLAESALQKTTMIGDKTIEELLNLVVELSIRVETLEDKLNKYHPTIEENPEEEMN